MKRKVEPKVIEVTLKVVCHGFSLLPWILFNRRLLTYVMLGFNRRLIDSWVCIWCGFDPHGIPLLPEKFSPRVICCYSSMSVVFGYLLEDLLGITS